VECNKKLAIEKKNVNIYMSGIQETFEALGHFFIWGDLNL
jgi:hypothetical protein